MNYLALQGEAMKQIKLGALALQSGEWPFNQYPVNNFR